MEEKKYCINCGTANELDDKFCCKCNEDLNQEENLFVDFLIDKTKDKFKGSIQDSIYDTIMNFLMSHLYGTVMTVSIVSYALVSSGVDVIGAVNSSHIENVNHPPIIIDDENINNVLDETEVVQNLVIDYVESFKNSTGNVNIEANSGVYDTNLVYDFETLKDPNMIYKFQYYTNVNTDNPTGQIAENLYNNNLYYAQTFMDITNEFNEIIGTYVFTLVKDNDNWYIVEADKIGVIEIVTMEDYALAKANIYRSYAVFKGYETYTDEQYQEFVSNRLPSSYGYSTSYEFGIDRFESGANGCLNSTFDSSGLSPSNPSSNIGPRLLSDNIPFVEFVLSEEVWGTEGYMHHRMWLIVVGYFDGTWYVVEDKFLRDEIR